MPPFVTKYRDVALAAALVLAIVAGSLLVAPFVHALLWATVLAVLTSGFAGRVERRMGPRFGPTIGAFAGVLLGALGIVLPFVILGAAVYSQLLGLTQDVGSLDGYAARFDRAIRPYLARVGVEGFATLDYLREHREDLLNAIRTPATSFAASIGTGAFTLVVALLTQFFMLRDGRRLKEPALQLSPVPRERMEALLTRLAATVRAVFAGTVFVSFLQGLTMGIFYSVTGVPNAVLLGVVMAALGIIPLIGSPFVYIPVAIGLAANGNVPLAVGSLLFGVLVVSNVDNVLKPFLIGGPTQLHPIAVFFAALGGVALIGPVGVVAGPMILVILLFLLDVVRERLADGVAMADGG